MFHQYFQPRKLSEYYPSQNKLVLNLLEQLNRSPDDFAPHIRQYAKSVTRCLIFDHFLYRYVSSIVLKAAYGYEVQEENDFYVNLSFVAMEPLSHAVHENFLVEFIPLLKHVPGNLNDFVLRELRLAYIDWPDWLPGARFKRFAKDGAKKARDMRDIPFNVVKNSMVRQVPTS